MLSIASLARWPVRPNKLPQMPNPLEEVHEIQWWMNRRLGPHPNGPSSELWHGWKWTLMTETKKVSIDYQLPERHI